MKWKESEIERLFRSFAKDRGYNFRDMMVSFGQDFTGQTKWAPIFQGMEIMGKRKTLERLDFLIKYFK
jgi:hypothetical protein